MTRAITRGAVTTNGSLGSPGLALESGVEALASGGFDVVIDFSSPEAIPELARVVMQTGAALVSGTTGLGAEARSALDLASARVAVFWEPNMSFGVHVMTDLVRRAAERLGQSFDVEVCEVHHRMKTDAPSGTANRLVDALREAGAAETSVVHGRSGRPGPRPLGEIGVHSVRGGDAVGDHTVHFLGPGERLEISHRATDRDVFVRGALRAAEFVVGKPPGLYGMRDFFG